MGAHYREVDPSPALTFNNDSELEKTGKGSDCEAGFTLDYKGGSKQASLAPDKNAVAQLIAVAVLELGIILHRHVLLRSTSTLCHANLLRPAFSALIGLTLAIDNRWKVLFVAVLFYRMYLHQRSSSLDYSLMTSGSEMFDGLALGSRLAYLDLPHKYRNVLLLGALFYGITTPIGIMMGLRARTIYTPSPAHVSLVSGTLGTLSASILLYTGFVELLAQEFLFGLRPGIREMNKWKPLYVLACVALGYGAVAFLGKWA